MTVADAAVGEDKSSAFNSIVSLSNSSSVPRRTCRISTYIGWISLRVIQMPVTKAQTLVNPAGTAKIYSVAWVGSVKNRMIAITTTAALGTRSAQPFWNGAAEDHSDGQEDQGKPEDEECHSEHGAADVN